MLDKFLALISILCFAGFIGILIYYVTEPRSDDHLRGRGLDGLLRLFPSDPQQTEERSGFQQLGCLLLTRAHRSRLSE